MGAGEIEEKEIKQGEPQHSTSRSMSPKFPLSVQIGYVPKILVLGKITPPTLVSKILYWHQH